MNTFIESENEHDNIRSEQVKFIINCKIKHIWTRTEVLLGLQLSGQTDTLTEARSLLHEFYKKVEIQNKRQYQNAPEK